MGFEIEIEMNSVWKLGIEIEIKITMWNPPNKKFLGFLGFLGGGVRFLGFSWVVLGFGFFPQKNKN